MKRLLRNRKNTVDKSFFYIVTSHHAYGSVFTGPFFLFMRGGDERDVSPVGHAEHAATLHARADERI